jgi:alginate O-acetyltransferase complex protein AlgI
MIQTATFWLILAGAVAAFWATPASMRMLLLGLISFAYIVWLAPLSAAALALLAAIFFFAAPRAGRSPRRGRWLTLAVILLAVTWLAYFKYVPPVIHYITTGSPAGHMLIPLGISFYTFKLIHYAIEVSRGRITDRSFPRFFCYLFLFPIFTAGPIERFDHFLANQSDRLTRDDLAEGLTRIIHGLIKKFVIAEMFLVSQLGAVTDAGILLERLDGLPAYKVWAFFIIMFFYAYFDFSAYSDIAIGASRLFGIRIMENFNWPILARNIGDFWKRWHMTLAGWCQAYVYMPMIGVTRNPWLAIYATFFIMGIWHAGSLHFIAWGLYHATGVAIYLRWLQFKRRHKWTWVDRPWFWPVGMVATWLFFAGSIVFTAFHGHAGISVSFRVWAKMLGLSAMIG